LQGEAFHKLQAAIFAGQVDTVVVWKLDRLARNLKEGVNVLADWCKRGGERNFISSESRKRGFRILLYVLTSRAWAVYFAPKIWNTKSPDFIDCSECLESYPFCNTVREERR
jgi:hypothetical protein